jgi:hypothetical protein
MTIPSPAEVTQLILILGEIRGDVKAQTHMLKAMDARVDDFEKVTEKKFDQVAGRVAALEGLAMKLKIVAAVGGILGGAAIPALPKIITLIFGA